MGLPSLPTPLATRGSHYSAGICRAFTLTLAERQVRMDPATRFYNRDDKVNQPASSAATLATNILSPFR